MNAPTRNVTVSLSSMIGAAVAGATVTAKLDRAEIYQQFVVADTVTGTTDVNGQCVLALFPNALPDANPAGLGSAGSVYTISISGTGGRNIKVQAVIPDQDCNLHDVVLPDEAGQPSPGEVIGAIRYNIAQTLTTPQQVQARANIGFDAAARAVVLTGLSLASAVAISATDSMLVGMGKAQGQLNALYAATGSSLVGFQHSGTGSVARTVQARLRDRLSLADWGLIAGGTEAANGTALASLESNATGQFVYVPPGTFATNKAPTQIQKTYISEGGSLQLNGDYAAHTLASIFSYTNATPTNPSTPGDPATAFTGSSKSPWRYQAYLDGAATGTQPTTGYHTIYDLAQMYVNTVNLTGWNESTTDAIGRTMLPQVSLYYIHKGQGDVCSVLSNGYALNSTPTRSTHWLADPAVTALAGGWRAASNSLNMVAAEYQLQDVGFETTMSGYTIHIYRDSLPTPNPKEYVAYSFGGDSRGAYAVDALIYGAGKYRIGLDTSPMDLTATSGAAIVTAANHWWYFNGANTSWIHTPNKTDPGTGYVGYRSATTDFVVATNGAVQFSVGATASAVNYVQALGAGTGAAPGIFAKGSDTDVSLGLRTKGAGYFYAFSDGGSAIMLSAERVASAVNWIAALPSSTGNTVQLLARGSDPNVAIQVGAKGDALVRFTSNGALQAYIYGPSSTANYVKLQGGTTTNPSTLAGVGETNAALNIESSGTGSIFMRPGGSTRGTWSATGLAVTGALSASGQITSTLASGTAPLVVASNTLVANLNAALLNGATFAAPGTIGGTTPGAATVTTLTATGQVSLGGAAGAEGLRVQTTASAVNWVGVVGATTGSSVVIFADGETNAQIMLASKGTSPIQMRTNGAAGQTQAIITHTSSAVNYLSITGGTTGNGPTITAGGEAAIPINISSVGATAINLKPGGSTVLALTSTGGAFTGAVSATTTILSSGATSGIGYATGAGGTVTQLTSKSTGVTLNKVCGQITMNNAALASAAKVSFVVTNSTVGVADLPDVCVASGGTANAYRASVTAVAAGSFTVTVENITAGSLSEAPVLTFTVIKGVTA